MNRLLVMFVAVAVLAGVAMAHTAREKSGDGYLVAISDRQMDDYEIRENGK